MVTMEQIPGLLGINLLNPHVIDQTGLTGSYDFRLEFAANRFDPASSKPFPDLLTAVQKQLGFKLEKIKAPLDVIVVDQMARSPAEP
jgi:uncharacterized protein (TIGR03435 family)